MKKAKKIIKNKHIYMFSVIVLLGFFMLTLSKARYVANEENTNGYIAKNFYFNSDLLSTSEDTIYTYGNGENAIELTLYNNEDELRFSEVDIAYTVILTDGNGTEIETKSGTLAGGKINTETINFDDLSTGTYNVTATATSPYTKTLYGTFYITEKNDTLSYEVSDSENSSILYLTISTNDYSGEVIVTYPNGVIINNTDLIIESYSDNSTITINVNANSEYSLIFFKEDITNVFSKEDFAIKLQ